MGVLNKIFTWWNDHTVGTALYTLRKGRQVGTDSQGNRYYEEKAEPKGYNPIVGRRVRRRWVMYKGDVEASRIPPEWHAWLHYTVDELPTETDYKPKSWEAEHIPNRTGTAEAYFPQGSLLSKASRPRVTGDYEAWQPK